jgi:NTE family protein
MNLPNIEKMIKPYQQVGLMLQGGGALGAYQAGVYKALAQAQCLPDWVCGVSIGAINGAIIVPLWPFTTESETLRAWSSAASSWLALTTGQPGFFKPRTISPWFSPAGTPDASSFYDSSELAKTLTRLIDFERLNSGEVRLSVGAVDVETGNNHFFDTHKNDRLEVEHIMASGALPPALPMVTIDGKNYWDGGIVSNTPLQYFLDESSDISSLIFQVDLFSAKGTTPQTMAQVLARQKDITYSSRTRQATSGFKRMLGLRRQLALALERVPKQKLLPGEAALMKDYLDAGVVNLIELIYQSKSFEGDSKDYEFSKSAMQAHMQAGYNDTAQTLAQPKWLEKPSPQVGMVEHDIHRIERR